jgi:hypothetical protein
MVDIQTISIVLAALSIIIGMIIGVEQLRDLKKSRQSEIKLQFLNIFRPEFLSQICNIIWQQDYSTFQEFNEKYGPRVNPEVYISTMSTLYTLNAVGLFLREKQIDSNSLFRIWNPLMAKGTWKQIEPVIKYWREHFQYPELFECFEYLVNEARRIVPYDVESLP